MTRKSSDLRAVAGSPQTLTTIVGVSSLVIVLSVLLTSRISLSRNPPQTNEAYGGVESSGFGSVPQSPITMELSISKPPALGEQVTLTIALTSTEQAFDTEVQVNLPEGLELLSGSLFWTTDLQPNQTQEFILPIKAVKNGDWIVIASAKHTVSTDPIF